MQPFQYKLDAQASAFYEPCDALACAPSLYSFNYETRIGKAGSNDQNRGGLLEDAPSDLTHAKVLLLPTRI